MLRRMLQAMVSRHQRAIPTMQQHTTNTPNTTQYNTQQQQQQQYYYEDGIQATHPHTTPHPSSSSVFSPPPPPPSSPSPSAFSLASAAVRIVQLERAFFKMTPEERSAAGLLAEMNKRGFYQRVLYTYQHHLSEAEAQEQEVIQQCWTAQMHVAGEANANTHAQHDSSDPFTASHSSSAPAPAPVVSGPVPISASLDGRMHVSHIRTPQPILTNHFQRIIQYSRNMRPQPDQYNFRARVWTFLLLFGGGVLYQLIQSRFFPKEQSDSDDAASDILNDKDSSLESKVKKLQARFNVRGFSIDPKPLSEKPNTRMKDVLGCDEAKEELVEVVEYLKDPSRFNRLGGKMPKGVLLLGPPGVGKTLLARAIAGEAGVPFFCANGSDFDEQFLGVGEQRLRELFAEVRKKKPSILFIDEIDTIGFDRRKDLMPNSTLNQLLTELDGFHDLSGVIVIAATNYSEQLDPALLRPGRFDRHVVVAKPDIKGRKAILDHYSKSVTLDPAVDLSVIARNTTDMSGADLSQLVNTAAIRAARFDRPAVTLADFEYANDTIKMGLARTSAVNSEELRRQIAVYESGKSLVALKTPHARPLHKVTIIQRGSRIGQTSQTQGTDEDLTQITYVEMLAMLDTAVAGRAAEELIFGTGGATNHAGVDLGRANKLARAMVMQYGFGARHGVVADPDLATFSKTAAPESKRVVDEEVKLVLQQSYERAKKLLASHESSLHRVSRALLQYETLDGAQVTRVAAGLDIEPPKPIEQPTPL